MSKGLIVSIYKASGMVCDNGCFSSHYDSAVLTGPGIPEIFEPSEKYPEIELRERRGYLSAVPVKIPEGKGCGPMFGGSFVHTSDSRFPSSYPIPLHDRWEPQEQAEYLSR